MKVTILTLTFPPEPAHHILELAEGLSERGHKVSVVTSLPSYPYGRIYEGFRGRLFSVERSRNMRIVRVPVIPSHSKSLFRRSAFYGSNLLFSFVHQALLTWKASDVIVAYHPPLTTGFLALFMKMARGTPFVHWVHDMWPETLVEAGLTNSAAMRAIDRSAKYIYDRAARIMVLSKGFRQNLIDKGVVATKINVIPNWANPHTFSSMPPSPDLCAKHDLNLGDYHLFYIGNLGEMQALDSVIKAMGLLRDEDRLRLVFLGSGIREAELRDTAKSMQLDGKVRFLGRVPPEDVPQYYALADALLVHIRDSALFRITIPHKIYEYMMASKPIVAAIKGDALEEVLSAGAGVACEPENPEAIANAIRKLKTMPKQAQREMGARGRQFLLDNRQPGKLIDDIEKILIDSAAARSHN
jgi:colanic acid biosynthesis glycosyl transferase WcaI